MPTNLYYEMDFLAGSALRQASLTIWRALDRLADEIVAGGNKRMNLPFADSVTPADKAMA